MKIKRHRKLNKNLNFYIYHYNFRQPYQLLVDGTFCHAALNNKINIADNIPRYLQGEIKLLTTQCAIIELEKLGAKLSGALYILKQYALHKCGHEGKPITASDCLLSMVEKQKSHYIIATQDRNLQHKIRAIPGTPLLYLHFKTPVLEKPSEISVKSVQKSGISASENEVIELMKEKNGIVEVEERRRKKKRKGPNPLSCLKKKTIVIKKVEPKSEKKRRKIRIPKHVKEELVNK